MCSLVPDLRGAALAAPSRPYAHRHTPARPSPLRKEVRVKHAAEIDLRTEDLFSSAIRKPTQLADPTVALTAEGSFSQFDLRLPKEAFSVPEADVGMDVNGKEDKVEIRRLCSEVNILAVAPPKKPWYRNLWRR